MVRPALLLGFIALVTVGGPAQGCRDMIQSATTLAYFPKRDMRHTVALLPNKTSMRVPDSLSVPVGGREPAFNRDLLVATWRNPVASSDSSIARGERKFMRTCVPCHGATMQGNGPVAARFIPPPDLLNASSRGRSDGFIFAYIRHGGAVMPGYGAQVTEQEAGDLINYIRHQQRTNPR